MKKTLKKQRHKARQYALALLYLAEIQEDHDAVNDFLQRSQTSQEVKAFASDLIFGVFGHQVQIEGLIRKNMTGWKLEKMTMLLRHLLLLATYEMLWVKTPMKVLINEAIILSREFINNESAPLVNKVLQQIYDAEGQALSS